MSVSVRRQHQVIEDAIKAIMGSGTRGEMIKKVIDLVNFSAQKIVRRLGKITL